jgi:GntR family transcriptional regulator of arabinose operon
MSTTIDKNSMKPIYMQVKDLIETAIIQGEFSPGEKILSENCLSKKYGIHRHTARSSLQQLSEEGLITSIPGRGWYVTGKQTKISAGSKTPTAVAGGVIAIYGIPLDSIQSYFTTSFLNSLLTSGASKNHSIRFLSDSDMHNIEVNGCCSLKFDVIIWAVPRPEDIARIEKLAASGIKVIVANRYLYGSSLPFVSINQYSGTRELASRLVNAGHRKIGCITSDLPYSYLSERWRGFCDALREADIAIDDKLVLHVMDSSDIRNQVERLFGSNPDMTALFLLGEIFHRQTFEYIKKSGRRIPEDISMAVFDKVIFDDFKGKIASVEQPVARMTEELFALISKLLAGEKIENGIVIEPAIFSGESIRRIQH